MDDSILLDFSTSVRWSRDIKSPSQYTPASKPPYLIDHLYYTWWGKWGIPVLLHLINPTFVLPVQLAESLHTITVIAYRLDTM